jgi:hypothetical protein
LSLRIEKLNGNDGALDPSPFVHFATVCDARNANQFRVVVDDVHYAPVTDPDAPLIFVASQFLASCGPWRMAHRFHSLEDARQHAIR